MLELKCCILALVGDPNCAMRDVGDALNVLPFVVKNKKNLKIFTMDRLSIWKEWDQINPDILVTYFITMLPMISNFGPVSFVQGRYLLKPQKISLLTLLQKRCSFAA